jgi:simple sugar transport system substrate-binding protein
MDFCDPPQNNCAFDRQIQQPNTQKIEGVNTIAPMHFDDAEKSMTEITDMILSGYQGEKIDVIWCCYDLYASGVYASLTEGGYDIPMVSIDICNSDIEKMSAENSPWKACATTNWKYNGEFGIRVLALELADEYENIIDPSIGKASDWLEIPGSLVTQDMVSGDEIDINNLADVADETYSDKS